MKESITAQSNKYKRAIWIRYKVKQIPSPQNSVITVTPSQRRPSDEPSRELTDQRTDGVVREH